LLRRRCIIPADAFYEWQLTPTPDGRMSKAKAPKVPHAIRHRDGSPMAFAGLWELWRPPHDDQGLLRTCAIVTTSANQAIAPIHHRMPVVLPPDSWDEWLDPRHHDLQALRSLLVPAPGDSFEIYPVGTLVNSANNDGPELLLPALHGEGAEVIENDGAPERLQFG
jgi:putative SOS response-associated peptidase YedK